jgi:hypothetical protein
MKLYNNNVPLNVYDIIYSHSNMIHQKLFDDAINKYCEANNLDKSYLKIIDQPNEQDVFKPSIAIIINNEHIEHINLTPYWNKNYTKHEITNIFNELLINEENKKNIEIEEVNYALGKITFKNKFNNKLFTVNVDKIDFNPVYKDKLTNTFSYMLKNI